MGILNTIFNMSITGSMVFLIFLLMRPFTKKYFNSSWHYKMLIVTLIFFMVPIGNFVRIPINLMPNISTIEIQEPTVGNHPVKNEGTQNIEKIAQIEGAKSEGQIEGKEKGEVSNAIETKNYISDQSNFNMSSYANLMYYIWIGGMIILLLFKILPYIKFKVTILKNSTEIKDQNILELLNICKDELRIQHKISLWSCNVVGSPMLVGILNPMILMPNINDSEKRLKMILTHELNHYKRKDILIKAFALLIHGIHWWNPLVYLLLKEIDKYCEYSIDEKVVHKMDMEDRKYYGQTILNIIDHSMIKKSYLTTSMGAGGKELKLRLENMLFSFKTTRKRWMTSLVVSILIVSSALTIACSVVPEKVSVEKDPFIVYMKEEGIYYSYLNGTEEHLFHEGGEFSYPLISKTGDYIVYTKEKSVYIYDMKEKRYEKIDDNIEHYYTSYAWIDGDTIVYSTDKPGFTLYNVSTKEKAEHLDEYYYHNFRTANKDTVYGRKETKWTTEEGNFSASEGIVEISLNQYDSKNKLFSTNIIIEGRKSTDEEIGYNPIVWHITEDGKYVYIMEKTASGSLSTDGVAIGVYDVENKIHTAFEDITVLPYEDNLSINPNNNNVIALISGAGREMISNKEIVLLEVNGDKTYKEIEIMDQKLVAMMPNFTKDGEKLLYSATEVVDESVGSDYNKAFEDWGNRAHHIYEYDLKTGQTKKVTEGGSFDFMPISISEEEILFARYNGNGYYSLIKLVNGKEEILADHMIFDYEYREGFYGHFETGKGMGLYLNKVE